MNLPTDHSVLAAALIGLLGLTLTVHLVSTLLAALRPVRTSQGRRPFVSLLRPICGVDRFDRETLASAFGQDYPDYEILFCVADQNDPAARLARNLIAAHPDAKARLLVGDDRISANPKLNNLVKGVVAARGEVIVMADANLLLPRDYLAILDDTWQRDTGLVSAPAIGVRAETFWSAVEGAFLNGYQARWQLAADALGLGFAQGKTLTWRREVLEAGGGMPALARNLAEDVAATRMVRAQGLKVRLPARLFAQPIGRRSAAQVWDRQLRWSQIRREGFPSLFALELTQGVVPPLAALAAIVMLGASPAWSLAALIVLWYGAEVALGLRLGWPVTVQGIAAMILRDLMLIPIWGAGLVRRGFTWRGAAVGTAPAAE